MPDVRIGLRGNGLWARRLGSWPRAGPGDRAVPGLEAAMSEFPNRMSSDMLEQGFRAPALSRTWRGGILAPGAGLAKVGEDGQGLASRW